MNLFLCDASKINFPNIKWKKFLHFKSNVSKIRFTFLRYNHAAKALILCKRAIKDFGTEKNLVKQNHLAILEQIKFFVHPKNLLF